MGVAGTGVKSFVDISCCSSASIRAILDFGLKVKTVPDKLADALVDKNIAMVFCQPSTRTRVSFEVSTNQMGGRVVMLRESEIRLHRGKSARDTAMALSQYVDLIVLRTINHATLLETELHSSVSVVNALTRESHPCQVLADILTYEAIKERTISGRTVAWVCSDTDVLNSWVQAAAALKFRLLISSPPQCSDNITPKIAAAKREGAGIAYEPEPARAVPDADIVTTYSWHSMGTEPTNLDALRNYQVNESLMTLAKPGRMFLRCMPAHIGQEVSEAVLYGTSSYTAEEAGNKLYIQKAILAWCFGLL